MTIVIVCFADGLLYTLRVLANVLFGPRLPKLDSYKDATGVEVLPLIILGTVLIGFGLFPQLLMGMVNSGVEPLMPLLERLDNISGLLGGVLK